MLKKKKLVKKINALIRFSTIVFIINISFAQNIVVSGKVTDFQQNPLIYANILAIPESDIEDVTFAITQENGIYRTIQLLL